MKSFSSSSCSEQRSLCLACMASTSSCRGTSSLFRKWSCSSRSACSALFFVSIFSVFSFTVGSTMLCNLSTFLVSGRERIMDEYLLLVVKKQSDPDWTSPVHRHLCCHRHCFGGNVMIFLLFFQLLPQRLHGRQTPLH